MADPVVDREHLELSGTWQLVFDRAGTGLAGAWQRGHFPDAEATDVDVPAPWNVRFPGVDGVAFYRKRFELPAGWQGRRLELRFLGASYSAQAWLNGAYLGSHEGAYTPFSFDATAAARLGSENELVVRVSGLSKGAEVDGLALRHAPASKQSWYYTYSGLWGAVTLLALPRVSLAGLAIEPDLARERVGVELTVRNAGEAHRPLDITLQVVDRLGKVAAEERLALTAPPGKARFTQRIRLPHPMPWSCERPYLYTLRAVLGGGDGAQDALESRFGMRDFTVDGGQFYLNGAPIYLRGVILQPNYPVTLVAPPERGMMLRELRLAKEAGFNLIRAHIRPAPPGYLDLTDELGLLVYAEAPMAWIKDSPRLLDHGRRELQALIDRDRNHPSVVFWGIYNENPGATALSGEELLRFARSLDSTRVVVEDSGGSLAIDQDFSWVDRARMIPDRATAPEPSQDVHVYVGAPVTAGVYEWLRTLGGSTPAVDIVAEGYGHRPQLEEFYRGLRGYAGKIFASELGYGGMADLDAVVAGYDDRKATGDRASDGDLADAQEMRAFRDSLHSGFAERRLERVFGSVEGLVAASQELQASTLTRQIEALLLNRRVSGFVVTQLNDVAWEFHAGLLDHWRNPKPVYHAVRRLNQAHCLVLRAARPAACAGEQVAVLVSALDSSPLSGDEVVLIRVLGPAGTALGTGRLGVPAGTGIKELGQIEASLAASPGSYNVEATLTLQGETLAAARERIWCLPAPSADEWPQGFMPPALTAGRPPAIARAQRAGGPALLLAALPGCLTEGEWESYLAEVEAGASGIVGALGPADQVARQALGRRGLDIKLHLGFGNWMGCYHWVPTGKLFAGLPGNTLAGDPYAGVSPQYSLSELGGMVLAGAVQNTQTYRGFSPAMVWYSDIEAVRMGKGRLIFCQYRAFDRIGTYPLAARLAYNLLRLAADWEFEPL